VIKMRENGFTLIEVLIAMVVGTVIMIAVYGYMTIVQKSAANIDRKVVTQQDTRAVLDLMASEIRMASYDFNHDPMMTTWTNASPLACMQNAPAANRGIKLADARNIAVAMDLDRSRVIGDGTNEYIVYSYDGASTLTRNVSCGGAQAILGGTAPYTNVANVAAGVTMFRYFDATNTELNVPINVPNIRRILITIVADTAENDLSTHKPKRMAYSTSVMVRNHGLSY
jgi:prepilin-type N-terminal cleavage/methylation domain-containing protein